MDERLKSAHESLNTSYCSIALELNCFLVSIFWCATGSITKRKVMTNSHVCPSLWQEKQKKTKHCALHRFQSVYKKLEENVRKSRGYSVSKMQSKNNPLEVTEDSLLTWSGGKKEKDTRHFTRDYPTGKALLLLPCLFSFITTAL